MFGKAFISVTYAVVYVYAAEIFPTEARSIGMGTASMFARISSMAAPYVGGPLVTLALLNHALFTVLAYLLQIIAHTSSLEIHK